MIRPSPRCAVVSVETFDRRAGEHLDTAIAQRRLDRRRHERVLSGDHTVLEFDDRDIRSEVAERGRHLERDRTAADQHDLGRHLGEFEEGLVGEQALGVESVDREFDRLRPGTHDHVLGTDLGDGAVRRGDLDDVWLAATGQTRPAPHEMNLLVVDHLLVFGVAQLVALVPDVAEGVVDAGGGCMEQRF